MKKFLIQILAFIVLINMQPAHAKELTATVKAAIADLVEDNAAFAKSKGDEHFKGFLDIQNPRVTMVMCSDSRVQTDNFSQGAENDIFVVRNIGNQFVTAKGSVEYGVDVLKTPVLFFVGHSHCGAVQAAMKDISQIEPSIRDELSTIDVSGAKDEKQGVIDNVNAQVKSAMKDFKYKVNSNKLVILGAIYDFRNDFGFGKGKLIIVNLNGETNPEKLKKSKYLQKLDNAIIGLQALPEAKEEKK